MASFGRSIESYCRRGDDADLRHQKKCTTNPVDQIPCNRASQFWSPADDGVASSYRETELAIITGRVRVFDLAARLHNSMARRPHHPPHSSAPAKARGEHCYRDGVSAAMEMIARSAHDGTHIGALAMGRRTGSCSVAETYLLGIDGFNGLDAGSLGAAELQPQFANRPVPTVGSIVLVRTGHMKCWHDSERYVGVPSCATSRRRSFPSRDRWI